MEHFTEQEEHTMQVEEAAAAYGTFQPNASIQFLWQYIKSLSLSETDSDWLSKRIQEQKKEKQKLKTLHFPKIDINAPISEEVMAMSCSDVPKDFDYEVERDLMNREWAK